MNKEQAIVLSEKAKAGDPGKFQLFNYFYAIGEIKAEIKIAINRGMFKCKEYFFDLTPRTIQAVIKYFTKKGFKVKFATDGNEQVFYLSWEPEPEEVGGQA